MISNVEKLRSYLKMSQAEFASKINISTRTLQRWENNQSDIKESTLLLIAHTFDVSYDWLLTGKGDMFNIGEGNITKNISNNNIDFELLNEIIVEFEKLLNKKDLELDPQNKADVIIKIYKYCTQEGKTENIDNLIRLVI